MYKSPASAGTKVNSSANVGYKKFITYFFYYNYKIDFGRTINIESKFKNYKAFFQKAVQDSSISKYSMINLRFTKQVVCTK